MTSMTQNTKENKDTQRSVIHAAIRAIVKTKDAQNTVAQLVTDTDQTHLLDITRNGRRVP